MKHLQHQGSYSSCYLSCCCYTCFCCCCCCCSSSCCCCSCCCNWCCCGCDASWVRPICCCSGCCCLHSRTPELPKWKPPNNTRTPKFVSIVGEKLLPKRSRRNLWNWTHTQGFMLSTNIINRPLRRPQEITGLLISFPVHSGSTINCSTMVRMKIRPIILIQSHDPDTK